MSPDAATDVHTQGTRVWVRDQANSWVKGEVLKIDGGNLSVRVEGGETVKCKPEEAHMQNPDSRGGVEVRRMSDRTAGAEHGWMQRDQSGFDIFACRI
jgi:hypothetical protein